MKIETRNLSRFNVETTKAILVVILIIAYMKIFGLIIMSLVGVGFIVASISEKEKPSVRINR